VPSRGRVAAVSRRMLLDRATHLGNHTSTETETELTKTIRCVAKIFTIITERNIDDENYR